MGRFTSLPPDEIERRRAQSIEAMARIEREEFDARYRERVDADYWKFGQRCSGCDYWASSEAYLGECQCGGKVPGREVLASAGIIGCSIAELEPGYPLTRAWEWCANFKDNFDWSELDDNYLVRIGAMKGEALKPKPSHRDPHSLDPEYKP